MSGHTLGPWKVAPAREGIIDIFDAHDHDVVTLYGGRMGNAQLIAAAPELLEALTEAVQFLADADIDGQAEGMLSGWRAIIAKAVGRS